MKLLVKAGSMIQREALLARLREAGIEPLSPPRDVSNKLADSTVDLALDGTAIFFDGFAIYVQDEQLEEAREVLARFDREHKISVAEAQPERKPWKRYYFCSLFSLMFPVLMTALATYHLIRAVNSGEKPRALPLVGYTFCYLVGLALTVLIVHAAIDSLL